MGFDMKQGTECSLLFYVQAWCGEFLGPDTEGNKFQKYPIAFISGIGQIPRYSTRVQWIVIMIAFWIGSWGWWDPWIR